MKKAIIKLAALMTAMTLMFSMAGCGERVVEESIWIEGEGTTQTITHSSGSSGTEDTVVSNQNSSKEDKDEDSDKDSDKDTDKGSDKNNTDDKNTNSSSDNSNTGSTDKDSDKETGNNGSTNNGSTGTNSKVESNNSNTNSSSGNSSAAINEDDRTGDKEEVDTNDNKGVDLKGKEVVITSWGGTREVSPTATHYSDWLKMVKDIEKKYNCKLTYKSIEDSMAYQGAWVTAAQSGVKFGDIVQLASSWPFPEHMKQDYLHPLDDYIDINDKVYNRGAMDSAMWNGKHYITIMINRVYVGQGLVFNPELFEKFGIKTPHEYINENNWNYDSFLEVAQALTKKDGGVQYYGVESVDVGTFANNNGGKQITKKNGKYTYTAHTDKKYLRGAQFAHDLLNKHKVVGGEFSKGTAAMGFWASYKTDELDSALGSNWAWAHIPYGWDVNDYQISVSETTSYGIPSTVKNPDEIAKIMYDFNYPYKWLPSFEEQAESKFPDEQSYQIYCDMGYRGLENHNLTPLYPYITRKVNWGTMGLSADPTKAVAPQKYFTEVAATAQDELDTIWEQ